MMLLLVVVDPRALLLVVVLNANAALPEKNVEARKAAAMNAVYTCRWWCSDAMLVVIPLQMK